MVTRVRWPHAYRVISTKYPTVSVFDRIASTAEFEVLLELERLTNPRARDEAGEYWKVRPADRISGPGSTPVMASFVYSQPSRFCDGTFGVYYASHEEATAIAESLYHTERRLRYTHEPSIDVDKRVYVAKISGEYDDVRNKTMRSKIYAPDPQAYSVPQDYARRLYDANVVDGIVYNSVRHASGECIAAFRPRLIADCRVHKYVQMRWDGTRIIGVADLADIRQY